MLHFDAYKVIKRLQEKGYFKEEAEGFIEAVQEIKLSGVFTRQDIHGVYSDEIDPQFRQTDPLP